MPTRKEIGNAGETVACRYLEQHGFTVVRRNYIADHGEIDIIAQNGTYLVFCEVKTRKDMGADNRYGRPARAVDLRKRAHLLSAAKAYLRQTYGTDRPEGLQPRMDVAEILYTEGTKGLRFRIRYIERAFGAGSGRGASEAEGE